MATVETSEGAHLTETLRQLVTLRRQLGSTAAIEFDNPQSAMRRLERLDVLKPNNRAVFTTGGSTPALVTNGKVYGEKRFTNISAHWSWLNIHDPNAPLLAIYPMGISAVTKAGLPIFHDPEDGKMRSVALEYRDPASEGANYPWLERRIEPLFNVEGDGMVRARLFDPPTPDELKLFYEILEHFESACQPDVQ